MTFTAEERWRLVSTAAAKLHSGATTEVQRVLRDALDLGEFSDPEDELTFGALRLLGQASRQLGDLALAKSVYERARALAIRLGRPSLESAAVEGLALAARADREDELALGLYDEAVSLAVEGDDAPGAAAVLSNKGHTLLGMSRFKEAERVLREALACEELVPAQRAAMEDNLSEALAAKGEVEEAIETGEGAAAKFEAAGMEFDRYQVLQRLEQLRRADGREKEAVETFAETYELIGRLEAESLEAEHYRLLPKRTEQIEADTAKSLEARGVEGVWLDIGLNAMVGSQLAEKGEELFEENDYEAAERSLVQALAHWEHLGAFHEIPRIHHALGMVYSESGQIEKAQVHLLLARDMAHRLGDAYREVIACTNLCKLALENDRTLRELDPLRLVARARALRPIAVEQRFSPKADEGDDAEAPPVEATDLPIDYGVLDSLAASICLDHGALDLAEVEATRSAELMEQGMAGDEKETQRLQYRLAYRLVKVYAIKRRLGKDEEADRVAQRLEGLAQRDDSPRTALAVSSALGRERFARDEWDARTLALLRAACDAFERMRRLALKVGDLAEYSVHPPFDEAIEVSIKLGLLEEAFHLLERSKARSLLDTLRDGRIPSTSTGPLAEEARLWQEVHEAQVELDSTVPGEEADDRARRLRRAGERLDELEPQLERLWGELEDVHPDVVAHRLARPATAAQLAESLRAHPGGPLLIELFVGPRNVYAFTLGADEPLSVERLGDARDGPWAELAKLVRDKQGDGTKAALDTLRHPALRELATFIAAAAGDRPVFLVPHQALHSLPLHLVDAGDGTLAPRSQTFHLPSASLLRYGGRNGDGASGVLVGGDPLGDLPFAALEAEAVATRLGTAATIGDECSPDWLAAALPAGHAPAQLMHLACHSVFHPSHGDRSGLMLSEDGAAALVSVRALATLDWKAELVMLSACSSGQHEVRDGDELAGISRALLGKGAEALIVALWNVPDLATYLLVTGLYRRLPTDAPWTLKDIGAALAGAQLEVRDLTAHSLLGTAIRLHHEAEQANDPRRSHCALAAASTAHGAAGNRPEWLRAMEAIRCLREESDPAPDIGALDWDRQASIALDAAYAAQPFAEPADWAAFVLSGST